ncbi:MAG: CBS domain-containing protein [Candidatus Adiutrix sp.]|jgi:acetoin utilization protein AcuB|nr:CBS domain-containing protein [Candidatus Adiutrix sp.]
MKIKYWMTTEPVTIGPDEPIAEAARVMKERGFRRLPVMDNGRLVGLVTSRNILEAQPSSVSTLSVHEARYLVAKLKVSDIMRKNPYTVSPDDDALTAMVEGHKKGLGVYPVLDNGQLVGIVTATDLFDLVTHIFGVDDHRGFIYLAETPERVADPGYLSRLVALLAGPGIALLSFITFPRRESAGTTVALVKISPGRREEAMKIFIANGYQILD